MENEIVVRRSGGLPKLEVTPEEWARRRQEFNQWVNSQLREGVDFGQIPGTDKPTLLKPGAEKIAQVYGCVPEFEITRREQNPDTGYLYVEALVRLVSTQTGTILGTGIGCCSSYESKYRWRWEWWNARNQPNEDEGWEQTRNGKWRRRIENRDLIDVWNTVLKIAKKRAFIDAALTVSGASEKFTQDVEDFVEAEFTPIPAPKTTQPPAPHAAPNATPNAAPSTTPHAASQATPQPTDDAQPTEPEPQPAETDGEVHTGISWGWKAKRFLTGAIKAHGLKMTVDECLKQLYLFWQVDNLAAKFGEDDYNAFTRDALAALKTFAEGK